MQIDILTLFPDMFKNVLSESMLKLAQKKKKIKVKVHNLRDWTQDKHKTADDRPYGGGSGMVIKIDPVYKGLFDIVGEKRMKNFVNKKNTDKNLCIVLLTPRGKRFTQKYAKKMAKLKHIVMICGHYEGVDERVKYLINDEISIGDYILTGGELPAMVLIDALARLIPGVLGDSLSLKHESFEENLLEYPQYTRPRVFEDWKVPDVLLNGNHKKIEDWRIKEAKKKTKEIRKGLVL